MAKLAKVSSLDQFFGSNDGQNDDLPTMKWEHIRARWRWCRQEEYSPWSFEYGFISLKVGVFVQTANQKKVVV